jgi:hypothetical protein
MESDFTAQTPVDGARCLKKSDSFFEHCEQGPLRGWKTWRSNQVHLLIFVDCLVVLDIIRNWGRSDFHPSPKAWSLLTYFGCACINMLYVYYIHDIYQAYTVYIPGIFQSYADVTNMPGIYLLHTSGVYSVPFFIIISL